MVMLYDNGKLTLNVNEYFLKIEAPLREEPIISIDLNKCIDSSEPEGRIMRQHLFTEAKAHMDSTYLCALEVYGSVIPQELNNWVKDRLYKIIKTINP